MNDVKQICQNISNRAQMAGMPTIVFIRDGDVIDAPLMSNEGKAVMAAIDKGDMRGIAGVYTSAGVRQLREDIEEALADA